MKNKTLLFIILLLSLIIGYLLFTRPTITSCEECPKTVCLDPKKAIDSFTKSTSRISLNDSRQLYQNYNKRLRPVLNKFQNNCQIERDTAYFETQYVWLSLKELKKYVDFLQAIGKVNEQDVSGMAIYLGAYGPDFDVKNDPKRDVPRFGDYRGRLTTFFAPTYYDNNPEIKHEILKHKPFYIEADEPGTFKGKYMSINFDSVGGGTGFANTPQSKFIMSLNSLRFETSLDVNGYNSVPPRKK